MMTIGYHLVVLGKCFFRIANWNLWAEDCTEASRELNGQIKLAKSELARKNAFFKKEFKL